MQGSVKALTVVSEFKFLQNVSSLRMLLKLLSEFHLCDLTQLHFGILITKSFALVGEINPTIMEFVECS